MTTRIFATLEAACDVCFALNQWGARRNNGATIALRDGKTVTLRPEYTSKETLREFASLAGAFE
jgi:hypothetical protein